MKLELNTNRTGYTEALSTQANQCVVKDKKWDPVLVEFINSMKDHLSSAKNGLALAANQVWTPDIGIELPAVFVVKFEDDIREFINPLIRSTGKSIKEEEACLSFPNKGKPKRRHKNTTVVYTTIESPGHQFASKFSYTWARAIQHEVDHLRGKTLFKIKH